MILSAVLFCCLVAVQATGEELGEIAVVLSVDTLLELHCTGTVISTPYVAINGIPISSSTVTELLANLGVEESVQRDSTGRLVFYFKLNVTNGVLQTFECKRSSNYHYKLRLTNVQVHHPPPENVTVKYSENSSAIQLQWNPPYSTLNNYSRKLFHVDPHIIQYTVYIINAYTIDAHTGRIIGQVNTTETELTLSNAPDDNSCHIYSVSAWNAGGEGEMSEPVIWWGSLLHDCQVSTDTSTTATSTTATIATATTSTTATNGTEGDTTATIGGNQKGDYTTIIVATASVVGILVTSLVAVIIIVIILQLKCNRKANTDSEEPYYSTVYTGQPDVIEMKENDAYGRPLPVQVIMVDENTAYGVPIYLGSTSHSP